MPRRDERRLNKEKENVVDEIALPRWMTASAAAETRGKFEAERGERGGGSRSC